MALKAHLESKPYPLPTVVDRVPRDATPKHGAVLPGWKETDQGSLFVKNAKGDLLRLSWESRQGSAAAKLGGRMLPAGKYELVGYRVVRKSEDGTTWHLSGTGHGIAEIVVPDGGTVKAPDVAFVGAGKSLRNNGHVGMAFQGLHGCGLTVYKEGKRIPAGYRILSADGKELASGKITYG